MAAVLHSKLIEIDDKKVMLTADLFAAQSNDREAVDLLAAFVVEARGRILPSVLDGEHAPAG